MNNLLATLAIIVFMVTAMGEAGSLGNGMAFGSFHNHCPVVQKQMVDDDYFYHDPQLHAIDQDLIDLECRNKAHSFLDFFHWFPGVQIGQAISEHFND